MPGCTQSQPCPEKSQVCTYTIINSPMAKMAIALSNKSKLQLCALNQPPWRIVSELWLTRVGKPGLCGNSGVLLKKYVTMTICLMFNSRCIKYQCALEVSLNKTNFFLALKWQGESALKVCSVHNGPFGCITLVTVAVMTTRPV